MKYNGFVTMIMNNREVLYEFKNGHFKHDGLYAWFRVASGPGKKEDFVLFEGRFPFKGYQSGLYTWYISELRFTF